MKPSLKPKNPNFSSGPCRKRPGYSVDALDLSCLGRSHRSALGKEILQRVCVDTARVLGLPNDYRLGVVPASDTGAVEMALWSLLGERPVDVLSWESFGKTWLNDIVTQLKIPNARSIHADYGYLADLQSVDFAHDVVFTWNGTSSGVKVPDGDWIPDDRQGLSICDATSAVFAMDIPWKKLDVVTFSWQKVLGGEGAHGVIILSPRAVKRLESYRPPWPIPKIFRLTNRGRLIEGIFNGATINTPSMLCVADFLDALTWVESSGGVSAMINRSINNLAVVQAFVTQHDWINFLAKDPAHLSNTSVCLTLDLSNEQVKQMVQLLEQNAVAYDIAAYRDAPSGLRIWCGATIEESDLTALMPWLSWAYGIVKNDHD